MTELLGYWPVVASALLGLFLKDKHNQAVWQLLLMQLKPGQVPTVPPVDPAPVVRPDDNDARQAMTELVRAAHAAAAAHPGRDVSVRIDQVGVAVSLVDRAAAAGTK